MFESVLLVMRPRLLLTTSILATFVLFSTLGCSDEAEKTPPDPVIEAFTSPSSRVLAGEEVELTWKTRHAEEIRVEADGVAIDLGAAAEPGHGTVVVQPTTRTTYRLVATGITGKEVDEELSIDVTPAILSFSASPSEIEAGQKATLSWEVLGATKVEVMAEEGGESTGGEPSGSIEVSPEFTTTFVLKAEGPSGTAEDQITVFVDPVIESFTARVERPMRAGMGAELSWKTHGARALVVEAGGTEHPIELDLVDQGTAVFPIDSSGRFVLKASSGDRVVSAEATVPVTDDPRILRFETGGPVSAGRGFEALLELSWDVVGATSVEIIAEPGGVVDLPQGLEGSGSTTVQVGGPTSFRFVAKNDAGEDTAEAEADVRAVPSIEFFGGLPTTVAVGDWVELEWQVEDASSIRLDRDGVDLMIPTELVGRLDEMIIDTGDHVFRLQAFNDLGFVVERTITISTGAPRDLTLTASPMRVDNLGEVELSWTSDGGTNLRVLQAETGNLVCETSDVRAIASGSCAARAPAESGWIAYRAVASNGDGELESEVRVLVAGGPFISSFGANAEFAQVGGSVLLSWDVLADLDGVVPDLHLEDDLGTAYDVGGLIGELEIAVTEAGRRTFQLKASTPGRDEATATVSVDVVRTPELTAYTHPLWANDAGDPVEIRWTSEHAAEVSVATLDDNGEVEEILCRFIDPANAANGSCSVTAIFPDATFRVAAANHAGTTVSVDVTVSVRPATISSFEPDTVDLLRGEKLTLEWSSVNGTSYRLLRSTGPDGEFIDLSTRPSATNPSWRSSTNDSLNSSIVQFPNGFTFPYSGTPRTSVRVGNQGFLGFDLSQTSETTADSSWTFPEIGAAAVDLAPLWRGLSKKNGNVWMDLIEGEQAFVVQWKDYEFSASSSSGNPASLNFEVVLWNDGDFEFRYGTMSAAFPSWADGYESLIGWQDESRTQGRTLSAWRSAYPGGLQGRVLPEDWTVPPIGSLELYPKYDTTYTLEIRNGHSVATQEVEVVVHPNATIYPAVQPADPIPGDVFQFSWRAYGVQDLTIEEEDGTVICTVSGADIDGGGCDHHEANEGTYTYTLRAHGSHPRDEIVRSIVVRVLPHLDISSFSSDSQLVLPGEPVELSWVTTSAQLVEIVANPGGPIAIPVSESPLAGSVVVQPLVSTTYTFTAERQGVVRSETAQVSVRTATVDQLGTTTPTISQGGSAQLTWETGGQGYRYFEDPTMVEVTGRPFVDISATGTTLTGAGATVVFPQGFKFPYFGMELEEIRMTKPGYLTTNLADNGLMSPDRMPHTNGPNRLIFPFWNAFCAAPGEMFWKFEAGVGEPDHVILQWKGMQWNPLFGACSPADDANFQAVLFADGSFEFRYGSIRYNNATTGAVPSGSMASIGFQDPTARTYSQLLFNTAYPGGLSGRTFRYELPGATGSRTIVPAESTEYTLCTLGEGWKECRTQRIVVRRPGDLAITELQIAPEFGSPPYFEVRGLSVDAVDLEGAVITSGAMTHTIQTGGPFPLGFGQYRVFAAAPLLGVDDVYAFGNSLTLTSPGELSIVKDGVVLAALDWDDTWPFDLGIAAELNPVFHRRSVAPATASQWCPASNPYDGMNLGSPGRTGLTCTSTFYDVDWLSSKPFIDIDATGTEIPVLRQATKAGPAGPIGFDFPYFGAIVTDVWASSGGWITFGAQTLGYNTPRLLPATQNPITGKVAPFWSPLNAQPAIYEPNTFKYETRTVDGKQVAIYQWTNYRTFGMGTFTMQAQLWEEGDIVFAYGEIKGPDPTFQGSNASIGIDNPGGTIGISYLFKEPLLSPWQSLHFGYKGPIPTP